MLIEFSPEDQDLANLKWYIQRNKRTTSYAKRARGVLAHRIVLSRVLGRELTRVDQADHIDGNGLNNKRENLRLGNGALNKQNRHRCKNKTGYFGVTVRPKAGRKIYRASVQKDGKHVYTGYFLTAKEAALAYNKAADL